MKIPRAPHSWRLSPKAAIQIQKRLASIVSCDPAAVPVRYIAGLDAAFSPDGKQCIAGVVLWDSHRKVAIEEHTAFRPLVFPYIPGLLSFREIPALLAVLRKLRQRPDLLMCDGQGLAHPRRIGIASHVGIICHMPSIGCAKSRLIGTHDEVPPKRGSHARLLDHDEVIGEVVRTQDGINPLFVSVGHLVNLVQARQLVLRCATHYRLPEPTRLADKLVGSAKRELKETD